MNDDCTPVDSYVPIEKLSDPSVTGRWWMIYPTEHVYWGNNCNTQEDCHKWGPSKYFCADTNWNGQREKLCLDETECKYGSFDSVVDCGQGWIEYIGQDDTFVSPEIGDYVLVDPEPAVD